MLVKVLVVTTLALTISLAGDAQTFLGVSGNGSSDPGNLVSVQALTGEITLISAVTDSGISGIAVLSDRRTFVCTIAGRSTTSTLIELDPDTGAPIAYIGQITASGTPISIGDLAVQPTTDVLYGIRSNADQQQKGGEIYTIDVSTGITTFIGSTADPVAGGLGFSPDGTLWRTTTIDTTGVFRHSLHKISPIDASTLEVTMTGLREFYDGLGVRPGDDLLFCTRGTSIYVLDPVGQTESQLQPGPAYELSDLAFDSGLVPTRSLTWGSLKRLYQSKD
jgi:hypothetical protein